MSCYEDDLRLEKRHALTIAGILGKAFVRQDVILDREQATDFAVFDVRPFKVGARLRTHRYLTRYGSEFTIRWSRPSGVPTEIHKIRQGLVEYIFYGFVSPDESRIVRYFIGDLRVFGAAEPQPVCIRTNTPPDSTLAAYRVGDMDERFIVKSYPDDWAETSMRARRSLLRSRQRGDHCLADVAHEASPAMVLKPSGPSAGWSRPTCKEVSRER